METQEIKEQFKQALEEVIKINGITTESAVNVATIILQESGKDRRAELYNKHRFNNNGFNRNSNQPATDKQKDALRKWRVEFSDDITKAEASALLDYAIEHANNNRSNTKGRS